MCCLLCRTACWEVGQQGARASVCAGCLLLGGKCWAATVSLGPSAATVCWWQSGTCCIEACVGAGMSTLPAALGSPTVPCGIWRITELSSLQHTQQTKSMMSPAALEQAAHPSLFWVSQSNLHGLVESQGCQTTLPPAFQSCLLCLLPYMHFIL